MRNDISIYFSSNPFTEYKVVSGSIFNKEFSETLDSATVILDYITLENRLRNIKPYEYVKVVNKGVSDLNISEFYLVDNYVEKEVNIADRIFQYTINLMSETKLLEKIQCPNLSISHSKVKGKKTIFTYICQYMRLYSPKVKFMNDDETWEYKHLIEWDESEEGELFKKFNVECADMSLSQPTLRQLLTSLMLQVGCIPTIKNRKLSFLDFNEEQTIFNLNDSVNYIEKSMSSDSYINSIVNIHNQVLDSENEVISEKIGFRNRDKMLLKQLDDLTIETKFPIYKINKIVLNSFIDLKIPIFEYYTQNTSYLKENQKNASHPFIVNLTGEMSSNGGWVEFSLFQYDRIVNNKSHTCFLKNLKIHFCAQVIKDSGKRTPYEEIEVIEFFKDGATLNFPFYAIEKPMVKEDIYSLDTAETLNEKEFVEKDIDNNRYDKVGFYWNFYARMTKEYVFQNDRVGYVWIECEFIDVQDDGKLYNVFMPMNKVALGSFTNYQPYYRYSIGDYEEGIAKVDMTPLLIEEEKRRLLDVDYTTMPSIGTLEDLAKYIYGTIGYKLGTKQISGFSETYSIPVAWWNDTYSNFENILTFIEGNKLFEVSLAPIIASLGNMPVKYANYENNYEVNALKRNFSLMTFDIYYQPLNSYNLKYTKDDIDIPFFIEQLDQAENGVVDFDRTSLAEQDKINRLGNEVLAISQTTDDFSNMSDVNSLYNGDYTIFKRTIAVENDYVSINCQASKNYVIQNYFTSITTKYRAFENIDYNQSILRKENQTIFVLIDDEYSIDGDKKIKLLNNYDNSIFASALLNYEENYLKDKIKYSYAKDSKNAYKNDISVISTKNMIAFIFEDYDNVSSGSYLTRTSVDEKLGGVPQSWGIFADDYYEAHEVGYLSNIPLFEYDYANAVENVANLPLINSYPIEKYSVFNLVDDNDSENKLMTFYKDGAEIINQTLQFVYYTTSKNIIWTEHFLNNCLLVDNKWEINSKRRIIARTIVGEFKVNGKLHRFNSANDISTLKNLIMYEAIIVRDGKIEIDWTNDLFKGSTQFKITWEEKREENGVQTLYYADIIAFKKRNDIDVYYISLNDTKTLYAYDTIKSGDNKGLIYFAKNVSEKHF